MKMHRYCALSVCLALVTFLLSGCTSAISHKALHEVDQTVIFEELVENPEDHKGKIVLLGGNIIETNNFFDRTMVVVLQRPLGFGNKPETDGVSKGRFIVCTPDFLDPAIYHHKRKITIMGTVIGRELHPLGKTMYNYPVIKEKEHYLWPLKEQSIQGPRVHFGVGIGIWH